MSWRHTTLTDCRVQIGQGHIEIDDEGVVVSPTAYALNVLRRYGSVAGFEFVTPQEDTGAEETKEVSAQAEANESPAPKKRRRTARKPAQ